MLKRLCHCAHCGAEMLIVRRTKAYCSDSCRKRAARGATDPRRGRLIVEALKQMGLVAKIWPVFAWDASSPVFALMVPGPTALEELNLLASVTESELDRALRGYGIQTAKARERLAAEIKAFYQARMDRRFRQGYTPSDTAEDMH